MYRDESLIDRGNDETRKYERLAFKEGGDFYNVADCLRVKNSLPVRSDVSSAGSAPIRRINYFEHMEHNGK